MLGNGEKWPAGRGESTTGRLGGAGRRELDAGEAGSGLQGGDAPMPWGREGGFPVSVTSSIAQAGFGEPLVARREGPLGMLSWKPCLLAL